MITKKIMEGGNNQLMVTLPKHWATTNNLKKGCYLGLCVPEEPTIEILEDIKNNNQMVVLYCNENRIGQGKIVKFVGDGVLLDSNFWAKFEAIRKISRSVKEVENE